MIIKPEAQNGNQLPYRVGASFKWAKYVVWELEIEKKKSRFKKKDHSHSLKNRGLCFKFCHMFGIWES